MMLRELALFPLLWLELILTALGSDRYAEKLFHKHFPEAGG